MTDRDPQVSEPRLLTILAGVQFVNVLEFMIVMPLGPDFATALGIPLTRLGWIGAAYTFAASIAGIVGSTFLDRFARRTALIAALTGLMLATLLASAAVGLPSLLAARVLAGLFGGPATALGYAILADVVPPDRRGRAMGVVLGSFSVASVLGVPLGLELARLAGWRMPFLAIATLTLVALVLTRLLLPPLTLHLEARERARLAGAPSGRGLSEFVRDRAVLVALLGTALTMMSLFMLVPHFSAYFQYNLGYPRARLGLLYLVGGAASFVAMRVGGGMVDRYGALGVAMAGSALLVTDLLLGFVLPQPWLPAIVIFVSLMLGNSLRAVAVTALSTRVPPPAERARFLSIQSSVQHGASAIGALLSSLLLAEAADHRLIGVPRLALLSVIMAVCVPMLVAVIAAEVRRREQASGSAARG